jgi:hypothetical protein
MMKEKHLEILKSAIRHFAITAVALYSAGVTDVKALAIATIAAVVGPAIRGIDKSDPAFGLVADITDAELKKIVKKLNK